jgi:hypothetical protein
MNWKVFGMKQGSPSLKYYPGTFPGATEENYEIIIIRIACIPRFEIRANGTWTKGGPFSGGF